MAILTFAQVLITTLLMSTFIIWVTWHLPWIIHWWKAHILRWCTLSFSWFRLIWLLVYSGHILRWCTLSFSWFRPIWLLVYSGHILRWCPLSFSWFMPIWLLVYLGHIPKPPNRQNCFNPLFWSFKQLIKHFCRFRLKSPINCNKYFFKIIKNHFWGNSLCRLIKIGTSLIGIAVHNSD